MEQDRMLNVSSSNRISLLPLYPTAPGNEVLDAVELTSRFRLDPNGNPDVDFLAIIQRADFWWSNYFAFYLLKRLHESTYEAIR